MKTTEHNHKNISNYSEKNRLKTISDRIEEIGLESNRFIRLQDGSKAPISHEELCWEKIGEGNYGVYAGNGLVLVDIDSYRSDSGDLPKEVQKLRSTLTITFRITSEGRELDVNRSLPTFIVQSPHGGEHLYYAVSDDVENSTHEWGEMRAENQYVVGPGSELTNCDKDWHDCSQPDEGYYAIKHNYPVRSISASELPTKQDTDRNPETMSNEGAISEEDPQYAEIDVEVANQHLKPSKRRVEARFIASWTD
ncbi:Bifunctional DNA primase/polymerase, N-terminal [Natronorubrum sediminis]|uniref:Bifunctional DNA primase/polymerase, N-terminal n=1 Tax=Natronorubrum sediminis TaxID=640943 RepID=A0A1H6FK23_9EURY|nr:bifunctional DNA primase/polymerase [Natronorubrum sediminis]SEH11201.1 Bifunctional DNA primase/polymerase, N-terminal [Natronorubrum sediminis]